MRALLPLAALALASCSISPPPNTFRCRDDGLCPPGQFCDPRAAICVADGTDLGPDVGAPDVGVDGGPDSGPDQGLVCPPLDMRPRVVLSGLVEEDTSFTCAQTVVLTGTAIVDSDVTLTFGPDVRVLAQDDALLLVARGGQLVNEGEADAPVVFTSSSDAPAPGQWVGVWLLGAAPVHFGEASVGGVDDPERRRYGGEEPRGSCGSLRFTRIEYAGGNGGGVGIAGGALRFSGCGSGTTADSVEVFRSGSEGINFEGGAPRLKRIVLARAGGRGFLSNLGFQGQMQFVIAQGQDRFCFEARNTGSSDPAAFGRTPISDPTIYNLTCISEGGSAVSSWFMFRGSAGVVANSIAVSDRMWALIVQSQPTLGFLLETPDPRAVIAGNVWSGTTELVNIRDAANAEQLEEAEMLLTAGNVSGDPLIPASALTADPDFAPAIGSPADAEGLPLPGDGFFEAAPYRGAIAPGTLVADQWWFGWARFD